MNATDPDLDTFAEIEGRRAAALYKHTITVMASISYGLLASAFWKPVFEAGAFEATNLIGTIVAGCLLIGSFAIAPYSEHD